MADGPPDLQKIMDSPGTPLSEQELEKLRADGLIPIGMNVGVQSQPIVHRITNGGQEYLVIVIDPPPCGCTRDAKGDKKMCKTHRKKEKKKAAKAAKKAAKAKKSKTNITKKEDDNMIRDDGSDRGGVKELRHAADSDEEYEKVQEGAVTPEAVLTTGPAGTAVVVAIQPKDGQNVAKKAAAPDKPVKGILIRGNDDCPQFIPADKVPKDEKGQPKMHRFTTGQLMKDSNGKAVFVADNGPQLGADGKPQNVDAPGINAEVQKNIGGKVQVACEVDVNEKGMVEIRQINDMAQANQDKNACIGVLTTNDAGHVVFQQTGGQAVGSAGGLDAGEKVGEARKNAKPGEAFAVIHKTADGKVQATTLKDAEKVDKKEVVAVVMQGAYYEPVIVKTKNADEVKNLLDKPEARKAAIEQVEQERKKAENDIEKADIAATAKMQKRPVAEVQREAERAKKARMGAASGAGEMGAPGAPGGGGPVGGMGQAPNSSGPKEVVSAAFGAYGNNCGGNRSVFATARPMGTSAPGGAGPTPMKNKSVYGGAPTGAQEVASVACGGGAAYNQYTNYTMVTKPAGGGTSAMGQQTNMSNVGGMGSAPNGGATEQRSSFL